MTKVRMLLTLSAAGALALTTRAAGAPVRPAGDAAPRLALGPLTSDPRGVVRAQVEGALCGPARCLAIGLDPAGRTDIAGARRRGARGLMLGSLWREPTGKVLSLALLGAGTRPIRKWVLPLGPNGRVAPEDLARVAAETEAALRDPPSPAAAPAPDSGPTTASVPTPADPPATRLLSAEPLELGAPGETAATPWLVLEAGIEPSRASLRFPSGGTAPVGYEVTFPALPRLRLEVHPFQPLGGLAAGVQLFADGTWLPGVKLPTSTSTHKATETRWRAGLGWRLPATGWLTAIPSAALEQASFVVGTVNGLGVPGLPNTRLAGFSGGLDLEATVVGTRITGLVGGRYVAWRSAGELAGGAAFFPGGSATGIAAEAGLEARLTGSLAVRLLGTWQQTRWSLDVDPSGAYTVGSATATAFGGRLSLRFAPW
jgi:hypothetical protein